MKFHAITAPNPALTAQAKEVLRGLQEEYDGYYAKPHGFKPTEFRSTDGHGQKWEFHSAGFSGDPDADLPMGSWLSSGGNLLALKVLDDGRLEIFIDSRRHGVPFLRGAGDLLRAALPDPLPEDLEVVAYETMCPDAHPLVADLYVPGVTPEPDWGVNEATA